MSHAKDYSEREIRLSEDKNTISIGRTSKRNSDFEASPSNGWFNSAVMSRNHATLEYLAKDKVCNGNSSGSESPFYSSPGH
jgi:pSer/pThr/pTyr-binding forkhead associated (FHA) protein